MRPPRARSVTPLLRLLALALLLLGVAAAPVASALGDVHALAHGQAGIDGDLPHEHDAPGPSGDPGDDAGDLLHALMHSGHCHGHSPALMPILGWQPLAPSAAPRPTWAAAGYRSHPMTTLLRPPIAA